MSALKALSDRAEAEHATKADGGRSARAKDEVCEPALAVRDLHAGDAQLRLRLGAAPGELERRDGYDEVHL
jgi:hypothetical protein